jgi:hypothetical protein
VHAALVRRREATVDRTAFVSEALTEFAVLRGQLYGRKFG